MSFQGNKIKLSSMKISSTPLNHLAEFTFIFRDARVFQRALTLFPGHSSLHLKYAGFLRHAKRDIAGADKQYQLAVQNNPENADALGSYASFLHGVLGNMDGASRYYEVAVKIDPTHANNMCNYGLFLRYNSTCYIPSIYLREMNPIN